MNEKGYIHGDTECMIVKSGRNRCIVSYKTTTGKWTKGVFFVHEIYKYKKN